MTRAVKPLQVKFGDVAGCDGAKTELVEARHDLTGRFIILHVYLFGLIECNM